ncbi:Rha family transcriptional regulator [uncultured Lamprocystis sp.]|jgi:Rha family phage regulatory protein|uniref:Rha family transcriptional regulator n=1 Tax=uncultured Lamprocystis sp. TaxID=543132 RepID=UPI0025EB2836|nr:Rha family transcriptional regulator [uncultured Lamprocystis sp.]
MSDSTAISLPADAVTLIDGHAVTTSRAIASVFGRRHSNVLRDISNLLAKCPQEFADQNFFNSSYIDTEGRSQPMYQIRKNGFELLIMSFTGSTATRIKVVYLMTAYLTAFDALGRQLQRHGPVTVRRRQARLSRCGLRPAA